MQVTEIKSEGLSREYRIVIPAADVEARVDEHLKALGKDIHVHGFRQGKAPLPLLRKRFGAPARAETVEKLVEQTVSQLLGEKGLRPAVRPSVPNMEGLEKGDVEFTLTLEILPEIDVLDPGTLTLERPVAEVAEHEIEGALQRLSTAHSTAEIVADDRGAEKGDVLVIDFVGKIDGVAFEGGAAEDYRLELGSGTFIAGFEDQLVGARVGERRDLAVTFPEDYGAESIAGKPAVFEVTVKELRRNVPSPIDDSLGVKCGHADLADLRQAIREERSRQLGTISRERLKRTLLDSLASRYDFPVPPTMLEQEAETIRKAFDEQSAAGKLDADDARIAVMNEEERTAEFRTLAERRVRLGLLLADTARRNDITLTAEDLNRALLTRASQFPGMERMVIEAYRKSPQAMEALAAPVFEDKVVDHILEMAAITDRVVTLDELTRDPDAGVTEGTATAN